MVGSVFVRVCFCVFFEGWLDVDTYMTLVVMKFVIVLLLRQFVIDVVFSLQAITQMYYEVYACALCMVHRCL